MGIWVLILTINFGGSFTAPMTQEFESRNACDNAGAAFISSVKSRSVDYVCVPKG